MDLIEAIKAATSKVTHEYFNFMVASKNTPIKRERVYCYELYHQLRCAWPDAHHIFNAEPDKRGDLTYLGRRPNPDLIFHQPGNHNFNHTVIEVECRPTRQHMQKDLMTFSILKGKGYQHFVLLLFGIPNPPWPILEKVATEIGFNLDEVTVLLHQTPGQAATHESRPR